MKYFSIKYLWKTFFLNLLSLPIFAQSKSNNFDEFCSNTIVPHKNTIDLNSKIDLREKYNHILRQWNSSLIQYQEVLKFYESEKFKGNQTNLSYLFSKMQNCTNLLDDLRSISIYIANQSHSLKQNTIRPQFNLSSEATTSPTTSTVEFFYPYSGVYLLSIITSIFIISIGGIIYWKYKKEKPVLNELHQIDNEDLEPNAVTLLKQSVPFLSPTVNNSPYDTPKCMYTGTGVLRTFTEQSDIAPQSSIVYDTPKCMYTGTGVLRTFTEQSDIAPQSSIVYDTPKCMYTGTGVLRTFTEQSDIAPQSSIVYDTPKCMYTGTGVLRTFTEQSDIAPQPFESTANSINSDSNEYILIESLQRSNSH